MKRYGKQRSRYSSSSFVLNLFPLFLHLGVQRNYAYFSREFWSKFPSYLLLKKLWTLFFHSCSSCLSIEFILDSNYICFSLQFPSFVEKSVPIFLPKVEPVFCYFFWTSYGFFFLIIFHGHIMLLFSTFWCQPNLLLNKFWLHFSSSCPCVKFQLS